MCYNDKIKMMVDIRWGWGDDTMIVLMAVTIMATIMMMEVVELYYYYYFFFLWNILGVEILFTNELNLKINYRILKKHRKILLKKYFI